LPTKRLSPEDRKELARRYGEGEDKSSLMKWLRDRGYPHRWDSIRDLMSNLEIKRPPSVRPGDDLIKEKGQHIGDNAIAHQLKGRGIELSADQVRKRRQRYDILKAPPATAPLGAIPFRIKESALILGCVHAPAHDVKWIETVVDLAHAAGVKALVLLGDFLNLDAWTHWQHYIDLLPSDEKKGAQDLLRWFSRQFDTVYYTMGNHECFPKW